MIYSNFIEPIKASRVRDYKSFLAGEIRLGSNGICQHEIKIKCPCNFVIMPGMNDNVVFDFAHNGALIMKKYEEDWQNFDDPSWNIPEEEDLFLMLTSCFTKDVSLCEGGKGIIQTPARHKNFFKKFAGGKSAIGKCGTDGYWECGIYKVLTRETSIIRITPAEQRATNVPYHYLIISDNQVMRFLGIQEILVKYLNTLNLDINTFSDWVYL